jgi:hypothetical protein
MNPLPSNRTSRAVHEQRRQRLIDTDSLRSWAENLLMIAKHDTMKHCLRIVLGDLDAGSRLLQEIDDDGPTVLAMIDRTTAHVRVRLRMIADSFEANGAAAAFDLRDEPYTPNTNVFTER